MRKHIDLELNDLAENNNDYEDPYDDNKLHDVDGNPSMLNNFRPSPSFDNSTTKNANVDANDKPMQPVSLHNVITESAHLTTNQFDKNAIKLKDRIKQPEQQMTFHWFIGVFIPVLINMVSVTYFMDLHRSINHIGWGLGFLYYTASIVASIGTLVSICVIATNGEMKDGGCYYLISRTLGPEIGGAIGIILVVAHATALSHRLHYISATIANFYEGNITISERWDRTLWHVIMSIIVLLLCLPGVKFIMYFLPFLAFLLVSAIVSIYLGFFIRKPGSPSFFTGLSLKTLTENFSPANHTTWDYLQFLGVLFPSANAVMTCANFSGNLRPVGRAIPLGGFTAMFIAATIICSTFLMVAGSFSFLQKDEAGLISDVDYFSFDASFVPMLTYIGFFATCLGSAITLSTGGARVLAKMIEDKLMPSFLKALFFRGEPFGCNIVIALIALIFAMIDNPTTSTQITNIVFSIPFALINFAVWTAASAHYPGFRPSFRFFNKFAALFLAFFCFARMFLMNWIIALITLPVALIIWFVYHKLQPADTWGTVTQSRIFYSTLKEELNLYHIKPHVKTFRPNIILISTRHPDQERVYIDFLNQILHGHGMAAIGRVFISSNAIDFPTLVEERDGTYLTDEAGYQTFYDVTVAETFAEGVRDLLLLMGIGMMRPNTICLSYPEGWYEEIGKENDPNNNNNDNNNNDNNSIDGETTKLKYSDFVNSIAMAFDANFSLTVLRNIELYSEVDRKGTIDVWWLIDDGGLSLLLPYLLSQQKTWKKAKLRLITLANTDEGNSFENQQKKINTLLYKFRINAEPVVIEVSISEESPTPMAQTAWNRLAQTMQFDQKENAENEEAKMRTHKHLIVSDLVREYSSSSSFVALTMMVPRDTIDPRIYMSWLEILSSVKVPFCLIRGNGENTLSWTV